MVVGVVKNDAYNGVITKSSFNFKHNSINFMTIYHDGVQISFKPLQPDFANDRFVRSYVRLFTQTGQYYRDTGNAISREQYKDGCALFAFDLTPQMDSSEVGFELIKHGNIRLEIHFATATARTLTVIVFAAHDTTCWILIKTETLLLTIRHEHVANRTLAQEGFENQTIFKKVCALDQLEKPTFPSAYVVNSDPSSEPGEHWVAFYFDKRRSRRIF